VEKVPHNDTSAEFHYAYHYGGMCSPHVKQEEPLKAECQHFLDCIQQGTTPLTSGQRCLRIVRILEASSESLKRNGARVNPSARHDGVYGVVVSASRLGRTRRKAGPARVADNLL
jgi:hypothetical protein